ncbi:3-phytase [Nocardiopsis arvandica]|uniref:3-phytase n=1 Tax=Nocardiopsis sinuspersici TaxID=501010 RepID=A0A7Z0BKJ4_9ACTN|nr:phytase [Nocardiopsis sinuspersici]NYH54226.1 3-phytase [Nocardiopsis sinuspersici]
MEPMERPPVGRTAAAATALALCAPVLFAAPALADDVPVVDYRVETPPVFNDENDADADDPAIWLNPRNDKHSLVISTAKEDGLYVHDLDGRELQHIPAPDAPGEDDRPGRLNNVDIVYGFELDGDEVDLAVVSDRGLDRLRVYEIDAKGGGRGRAPLRDVTDPDESPLVFSEDQDEVNEEFTAYGLTTWSDGDDHYAVASRSDGAALALLELDGEDGAVGYEHEAGIDLPTSFGLPDGSTWEPCVDPGELPVVEGMVVDAERGLLYAAYEQVGILRMPADLSEEPELVDTVQEFGVPAHYDPGTDECVAGEDPGFGGADLSADVEGLALYRAADGEGYLIASSQGSDAFVVYDRDPGTGNALVGSFRLGDPEGEDMVRHTDGIDVLNVPVGRFDDGLFVAQDGENQPDVTGPDGGVREQTNLKFARWDDIAAGFEPALTVDPRGWHPRR